MRVYTVDLRHLCEQEIWLITANFRNFLFVVTLLSDICSLRSLLCVWDDYTWRKKNREYQLLQKILEAKKMLNFICKKNKLQRSEVKESHRYNIRRRGEFPPRVQRAKSFLEPLPQTPLHEPLSRIQHPTLRPVADKRNVMTLFM